MDDAARRRAEAIAPYTALIRHELGLPPGADAKRELAARLDPPRAVDRPPAEAPGIARLRRVLTALQAGRAPRADLEQLTNDLRFLRLFEPSTPAMERDAMSRLLSDVLADEA